MGKATTQKAKPPKGDDRCGHDGNRPDLVDVKNKSKVERGREIARRNANHCVVCRLAHQDHIDTVQRDAAERLQDDNFLAGLSSMPGAMAALTGRGGGGGTAGGISDTKIDASRRLNKALDGVGTGARYLLDQIVLQDAGLHQVARILRIHEKGVLPALRVALDALAAHYGLTGKPGESGRGTSRIRSIHPFHDIGESE